MENLLFFLRLGIEWGESEIYLTLPCLYVGALEMRGAVFEKHLIPRTERDIAGLEIVLQYPVMIFLGSTT